MGEGPPPGGGAAPRPADFLLRWLLHAALWLPSVCPSSHSPLAWTTPSSADILSVLSVSRDLRCQATFFPDFVSHLPAEGHVALSLPPALQGSLDWVGESA